MKRIIKIDEQILFEPGRKEFAIYCTVTDRFEMIFDSVTWESSEELAADFDILIACESKNKSSEYIQYLKELKERFVDLARGNGY